MSKRQKVFDFIKGRNPGQDGWVPLTNRELAEGVGMKLPEVQQIVGSLKATGNLNTRLSDNRQVIGIQIIKEPSMWRRSRDAVKRVVKATGVRRKVNGATNGSLTPSIDRYGIAKQAFEALIADEAVREYLEATWNPNPVAEEGLDLKRRLDQTAKDFADLQARYQTEHRALEYLRTARNQTLRGALKNAGVAHGD